MNDTVHTTLGPRDAAVAPAETRLLPVGLLFLLSGAAALVYQVAWQRILVLHSGVGVYSVAVIVAVFMAGLGIGSHWGGAWSARLSRRGALRAFALLELGIALLAAASVPVYYDLLYVRASWLYTSLLRSTLLHLLALLPPTILMGMSLPFLVQAMVRRAETAGRTIGLLYGVNVVGAALGALATPWVLIRCLGIPGAVSVGVALNAGVALGALLLGRSVAGDEDATQAAPPRHLAEARPPLLWTLLYAASGFCALSLEILWFRLMEVGAKSIAFTFGTILALFLGGYALGSLGGAGFVRRVRQPLRAFLVCQCLILALSAAAVTVLAALPADFPGLGFYLRYWSEAEGLRIGRSWDFGPVTRLYVLLPVLLYGAPTVLMGLSFPILQRAVQDDPHSSGYKVGLLQAANIAGCVAGSLLVGLVALDHAGTAETLRALTLGGLVFAAVGLRTHGLRSVFTPLAVLLVTLAVAVPREQALWARLHGQPGPRAFFGEDASGVVALTPEKDGRWRLSVGGLSNSWLPYGGVHTWLGATPAIVHPAPRDVAVIGLGSGDTAWAAACRPETERVTVYEICRPQRRLLERLAAFPDAPAKLGRLLGDPRIETVFADGRHAVHTGGRLYDVIEADALRPSHAGSGNLYSVEFFERMGRKLKPGGLMCTWVPSSRTYGSFVRAFPHVVEFSNGLYLVGSRQPIRIDVEAWTERLYARRVRAYLGEPTVSELVARLRTARPATGSGVAADDLNHDLYPRDEFRTLVRAVDTP